MSIKSFIASEEFKAAEGPALLDWFIKIVAHHVKESLVVYRARKTSHGRYAVLRELTNWVLAFQAAIKKAKPSSEEEVPNVFKDPKLFLAEMLKLPNSMQLEVFGKVVLDDSKIEGILR